MHYRRPKTVAKGFTLVEIAIVLVIIGLLLGGILKGQELINNARVRAIADRSNSLKSAWYAFIDRYQAIPGDFTQATRYVPNASANGDGDGKLTETDSPLVFNHLSGAGLLRCAVCTGNSDRISNSNNSLVNLYGGVMSIFSNSQNYLAPNGPGGNRKLMTHTGSRLPSNIVSEVDRKVDDGQPQRGDFRFVDYDPAGPTANSQKGGKINEFLCLSNYYGTGPNDFSTFSEPSLRGYRETIWRDVRSEPPTTNDCGGGSFF